MKNGRMNYYPQGVLKSTKVLKDRKNQNKKSDLKYYRDSHKDTYGYHGEGYPKTLLIFPNPNAGNRFHPTQKPVALLEYLIKTYTLENETVLDFTMGSGSTGVACKNLNRKFIGIEKEDKYFKIAQDRILGTT